MTYPSNPQDYSSAGTGGQPGYSGAPEQGYPSQAGNPGAYPPQQGVYPPQPGIYPPAYTPQPQPGYPPQPVAYPPAGYGYGQPYVQAQMMPMPGATPFPGAVGRPKAQNPLATRALIYGALSLGANIVGLFLGFYLTGIAAAFTIYYSIRALAYAGKLPGKEGTGPAVAGLVLAALSLLISLLGYVVQFSR